MGGRTFNEMTADFFQHYGDKDYVGALEILNREAADFPEQASLIAYNQACMLAVQNLAPEALAALRQAADKGYWYDEKTIREDTDFAALQGNPEFETLVGRFKVLFAAKQEQTFTTRTTLEPATSAAKPYPLLLALHGNQTSAAATVNYWEPAAKAGWLVGVLQSSQIGFGNTFVWNDETRGLQDVEQNRAELIQASQADPQRIVVGGFSAGGRIAALIGLTQSFPVQGFIGVGAFLAGKLDEWQALMPAVAERGTRVYLIIGDNDNAVGYQDTLRLAEMLKAANVPHQLKVYPGMGHVYPPDFDQVLLEALAFITAGERVSA